MNYCDKIHYYLYTTENASFGEMVDALLMQLPQDERLFRLVFFGTPEDNRQYAEHCAMLRDKVYRYCGDQEPALSYVSQPPLNAGLLLEVISRTSALVSSPSGKAAWASCSCVSA